MLELKNIAKKFESFSLRGFRPVKTESQVLENASVSFEKGKIHLLTGRNGSGKTTLLRLISGRLTPDSGEIFLEGRRLDPRDYPLNRFSAVLDPSKFYWQLTARENLVFFLGLRNANLRGPEAGEYAEALELTSKELDKKFGELSAGNMLKVFLLRAFLEKSEILLLDEGLKSLDLESLAKTKKTIKELLPRGKTVIISAHNPEDFRGWADAFYLVKEKRVTAYSPEEAEHAG